jgi:hypothetical protein
MKHHRGFHRALYESYCQYSHSPDGESLRVWRHKFAGTLYSGSDEPKTELQQPFHVSMPRGSWIGIWWHGLSLQQVPAWIWMDLSSPISGVMYDTEARSWLAIYKAHMSGMIDLYRVGSFATVAAPGLGEEGATRIGAEKLDRILSEVATDRNGFGRAMSLQEASS